MNKAEFEALPIVEADGPLWREDDDPHDWVDDSDRTWEIFRHNGVLSRQIARRWVQGATRTMRSDMPPIQNIPKDAIQAMFESELSHLDLTKGPPPKFAGAIYADEKTEAAWVGFRAAMRSVRMDTFERALSHKIVQVWNQYLELDNRLETDNLEFMQGIHTMQNILATRVARRANPDLWRTTE